MLDVLTAPSAKPSSGISLQTATLINFDAAQELLTRNECIWKELNEQTEVAGKQAQDADSMISALLAGVDRQKELVVRFHEEVSRLPQILQQLQEITNSLAQVDENCDLVEAALVQLETLCEEQVYQANVDSHHKQLAVYKMKKDHELNTYRVQLARAHTAKAEELQQRKKHLLKERQMAYAEEFAHEVDYYKKHGKTGKASFSQESDEKLDLADVEIEEDKQALDEFLGDTEMENQDGNVAQTSDSDDELTAAKAEQTKQATGLEYTPVIASEGSVKTEESCSDIPAISESNNTTDADAINVEDSKERIHLKSEATESGDKD
ncbi:centromere protein K-like isoform X2 [Dreissena polymorpha]|uniref:centromere protein K-like isoform X2 n=1 Tax=Dreissena polymorpha TaxID=45954 RepID=UPI0022643115|nr:centromere protein K-like isoform X2 [Dreissena polymorpha]